MHDHQQLFRDARGVVLTPQERRALRAHLDEAMGARPLPVMGAPASGLNVRRIFLSLPALKTYRMPLALAFLLLFSGGTAVAAQSALPGSVLYPIKINVDENVQSVLAFSAEQKAAVAASHAEERVKEANQLSAQGTLSTTTEAELRAELSDNLAALQVNLAALTKENPKAAQALTASLNGKLHALNAILVVSGVSSSTASTTATAAATSTATLPNIQILIPLKLHFDEGKGKEHAAASTTLKVEADDHGRGEHEDAATSSNSIRIDVEHRDQGDEDGDDHDRGAVLTASTTVELGGLRVHEDAHGNDNSDKGSVHEGIHIDL